MLFILDGIAGMSTLVDKAGVHVFEWDDLSLKWSEGYGIDIASNKETGLEPLVLCKAAWDEKKDEVLGWCKLHIGWDKPMMRGIPEAELALDAAYLASVNMVTLA